MFTKPCTALGVNLAGHKPIVLGLWLAETGKALNFGCPVLTVAKIRAEGCLYRLRGRLDRLSRSDSGPSTHRLRSSSASCTLVRNSLRYVADKDSRPVVTDLKRIYQVRLSPKPSER